MLLLAELFRGRSCRAERPRDELSIPVGDAPYRKDTSLSKQLMGEAAEFGLADKLSVPIYSARWWQSAFSFAGDRKIETGPKGNRPPLTFALSPRMEGSECSMAKSHLRERS